MFSCGSKACKFWDFYFISVLEKWGRLDEV